MTSFHFRPGFELAGDQPQAVEGIVRALQAGDNVNLERCLTLGTLIGGHLVSGHVDGVGEVLQWRPVESSVAARFSIPAQLSRYVAVKGSICVDGVSLTVNAIGENWFEVNFIPHTLTHTVAGDYMPGRKVNIEVDLIARYLERLSLG